MEPQVRSHAIQYQKHDAKTTDKHRLAVYFCIPVQFLYVSIDISRWPIIQTGMKRKIRSTDDLEEVIKSYNPKVFNVSLLHTYFKSEATLEERERFFDVTLPKMQQMMLNMPNVITMSPKLLLKNENSAVYMTQEQCAHILVAAFFCTFPRRNKARYVTEYDVSYFVRFRRHLDNLISIGFQCDQL